MIGIKSCEMSFSTRQRWILVLTLRMDCYSYQSYRLLGSTSDCNGLIIDKLLQPDKWCLWNVHFILSLYSNISPPVSADMWYVDPGTLDMGASKQGWQRGKYRYTSNCLLHEKQ